MLGTIFRRILIHLYSCNGDLVQQEVACVNQLRCVTQECTITAALTGLGLQSCHVRVFSPSKIKSRTALQGCFAVVHFLPNRKTVSPSKQLSPKHCRLCAPCQTADQISFFRGDCSCLFWAGIHFHQLQKTSRDITACVIFGGGVPADYGGDDPAFLLNIPSSCACREVALPPSCTGIHPRMQAAPSTRTLNRTLGSARHYRRINKQLVGTEALKSAVTFAMKVR